MQPLLASKLEPSANSSEVIARPRLFDRLNKAVDGKLTLLTSPAGWGKTALLSSWIESGASPFRVAWVSLESSENDPVRFWNYVITALRLVIRSDQGGDLRSMSSSMSKDVDFRVFLALVINGLSEIDEPIVLVLEDADELRDPEVLEQLDFLIIHAPSTLRIVMTGRTAPLLAVARLRTPGQVSVLRPAALAFSAAETRDLLSAYEVDAEGVSTEALRERTDGWISGIQMALLSARDSIDPSKYLSEFGGDEPLVAEYLFSEVLSGLSEDVQDFMLRTSITSTLPAELAVALTGRDDAPTLLDDLERRNLFTSATSTARNEFTYSPVFREFLQSRLSQRHADEVRALHLAASRWLSERGRVAESIEQAILAQDRLNLFDMFGSKWLSLYLDGEYATLQRVLDSMVPVLAQDNAETLAVQSLLHLAGGDLVNGEEQANRSAVATARDGAETPGCVAAQSLYGLQRARILVDLKAARGAYERLTSSPEVVRLVVSDDVRALALFHLGTTEVFSGALKDAEIHLLEALSLARRTGREYIALGCLSQQAPLATINNRLSLAAQISHEVLEVAERRGWTHTTEASTCWHVLAWIHLLRGELDDADVCLDHAEDAARRNQPVMSAIVRCDQGLVLGLRGDQGAALSALTEAAASLQNVKSRFVFWTFVCAERARITSAMGDAHAARAIYFEIEAIEPRPIQVLLAEAQMLMDASQEDDALDVLEPALGGSAEGPHEDRVQALLMAAVAHDRRGRGSESRRNLQAALDLGRREKLRQPFMRLDNWVAPLLRSYLRHPSSGPTSAYVASVLDVLSKDSRSLEVPEHERLSEREVEVLRMLPDLMTVPELAAALFISVNTVKAHLKSIYRKLGAPNRRTAVRIASERGLL